MALETPHPDSVFYEDDKVYACLAHHKLAKGHSIVAWKSDVEDLHLLSRNDYLHLMEVLEGIRNALLEYYEVEKVYLIYADEAKHVHWHLVPRYDEKGLNMLNHTPKPVSDFGDAAKLKSIMDRNSSTAAKRVREILL